MNKKLIRWIFAILILAIVFLIVGKKSGWFGEDLVEVEVSEAKTMEIQQKVSATGKIYPETEVKLSSEVSGEIVELPVKEGQQVKKGDLLVKINPDIIQSALHQAQASMQNVASQLNQAEANEERARINFDRNQDLYSKGVISKAEWEAIDTEYKVAKANVRAAYYSLQSASANVKQAQDNLARTTIYAPMDGTVSMLNSEVGERVVGTAQMTGTEILRIADLMRMEVEVEVNENDIVKVALGDEVDINVDAYPKRNFKGEVTEIANSAAADLGADQVTNFKVKIKILPESYKDLTEGEPECYAPFRPGMTATVDIITEVRTNVIGLPIGAIVMKNISDYPSDAQFDDAVDDRLESIFVYRDSKVYLQQVETGVQGNRNIEILSGVSEGDQIVTGPYSTVSRLLKDAQEVTKK